MSDKWSSVVRSMVSTMDTHFSVWRAWRCGVGVTLEVGSG